MSGDQERDRPDLIERIKADSLKRIAPDAAEELDALRKQVELYKEAAQKKGEWIKSHQCSEELAASQAREAALREALWKAHSLLAKMDIPMISDALDMVQDDTALKAYGAKLLRDAANGCIDDNEEYKLNRMADKLEGKK